MVFRGWPAMSNLPWRHSGAHHKLIRRIYLYERAFRVDTECMLRTISIGVKRPTYLPCHAMPLIVCDTNGAIQNVDEFDGMLDDVATPCHGPLASSTNHAIDCTFPFIGKNLGFVGLNSLIWHSRRHCFAPLYVTNSNRRAHTHTGLDLPFAIATV